MLLGKFSALGAVGLLVALAACTVAQAQRGPGGGGPRGFGPGGFGGRFGAGPLELVRRDDVQKELGLTTSQIEKMGELSNAAGGQRGQFEDLRDLSDEQRQEAFAKMREEREKRQQETRKQIHDILDAGQRSRFSELEFQFSIQRGSPDSALAAAGVTLSEQEQQKMRQVQEQVTQRTREQIAKIQRDAQMEILGSVIGADRVSQLMGQPFEFQSDAGPGFGRGGRDGARGGNRASGRPQRPAQEGDTESEQGSSRRRRRAA